MKVMNNFNLIIFALGSVFMVIAVFAPVFAHAQDLSVTKVEVSDIQNGSADIAWYTPGAKTAGVVYVGESADKFDYTYRNDGYTYNHSVSVGNLKRDKTYFFKIKVLGQNGDMREMFIRSFSTGKMNDTEKPEFLDFEVVHSSHEAAVLHWTTSEDTTATIEYGTDADKAARKAYINIFDVEHEATLYHLTSGVRNYIQLTISDRDKNIAVKTVTVTPSGKAADAKLTVSDIAPAYIDSSRISARTVRITYKTNLPAKSRIYYGTSTKSLSRRADVSISHDLRHSVELEGLEPRTTYFYKIECYDSIYQKKVTTDVLSFDTGDLAVRYPSGSLLHTSVDDKIYLISGDTKAWIENPAVFLGLGFKSEWVQEAPASTLMDYEEVDSISNFRRHPNGCLIKYSDSSTVYLLENNKKMPIGSEEAFVRHGFKWERVMVISKRESYATGNYIS